MIARYFRYPEGALPNVAALAYAVDGLARRDSGLRNHLARLVSEAQQHPTAGALVTQIAGHAPCYRVRRAL